MKKEHKDRYWFWTDHRYCLWYDAYILLAAAGAVLSAVFFGSPWFLLLWGPYLWGLCLVHVAVFCVGSFLLNTKKEVKHIRRSFLRFYLHQTICILLKVMRVRVHIRGMENVPKGPEGFLLVSNHLSHFDPFVEAMPFFFRNVIFISKPENLAMKLIGPYITRAGFLGINRLDPLKAMKTVLTAADRIANDRCVCGVYPEGTISRDLVLHGFHDGVFLAARRAHSPVVVCSIVNSQKIKKNWYKLGTDVYLTFEGAISSEEVAANRPADVGAKAREMMRHSLIAAGMEAPPNEEATVPDLAAVHASQHPEENPEPTANV